MRREADSGHAAKESSSSAREARVQHLDVHSHLLGGADRPTVQKGSETTMADQRRSNARAALTLVERSAALMEQCTYRSL